MNFKVVTQFVYPAFQQYVKDYDEFLSHAVDIHNICVFIRDILLKYSIQPIKISIEFFQNPCGIYGFIEQNQDDLIIIGSKFDYISGLRHSIEIIRNGERIINKIINGYKNNQDNFKEFVEITQHSLSTYIQMSCN